MLQCLYIHISDSGHTAGIRTQILHILFQEYSQITHVSKSMYLTMADGTMPVSQRLGVKSSVKPCELTYVSQLHTPRLYSLLWQRLDLKRRHQDFTEHFVTGMCEIQASEEFSPLHCNSIHQLP